MLFLVCVTIITAWQLFDDYLDPRVPRAALEYNNTIVVLQAILAFCIFNKLNINSNKINYISKSTFAVFLIHSQIFNHIVHVSKYINSSPPTLTCHICISSVVVFMISVVIDKLIISPITKLIMNLIRKKLSFVNGFLDDDSLENI